MSVWLGRCSLVMLTGFLFWLVVQPQTVVHSQTPAGVSDQSPVQMVSTMLPTGIQQLVVLDVRTRTMAVYHVEPVNGKLQLKSVRNLVWDLQMEHFNGQPPLPGELRQVQP
jgi:hypothetical protein